MAGLQVLRLCSPKPTTALGLSQLWEIRRARSEAGCKSDAWLGLAERRWARPGRPPRRIAAAYHLFPACKSAQCARLRSVRNFMGVPPTGFAGIYRIYIIEPIVHPQTQVGFYRLRWQTWCAILLAWHAMVPEFLHSLGVTSNWTMF